MIINKPQKAKSLSSSITTPSQIILRLFNSFFIVSLYHQGNVAKKIREISELAADIA